LNAIRNVQFRDLEGYAIYSYREDMNGDIANCRPCAGCMQALRDYGVFDIYYTTKDGYAYERLQ
jgi:cytidine deaminase